jgi:pimeloyl-ACP methyl ester carboxylesterase
LSDITSNLELSQEPSPVEIDFVGLTVRGTIQRGDANWVLLLHEPGGDLDDWGNLPGVINESGYSVLALDLPGHGLSDDPWEPRRAVELVDALARFAVAAGAAKVFVIAPGALAAAALTPRSVAAAVVLSPTPPTTPLPDKTPPVLVLVGGSDREASDEANVFFRATRGWAVVSSFGTDRQGATIFQSEWGRHALEQTLAFLRDYGAR